MLLQATGSASLASESSTICHPCLLPIAVFPKWGKKLGPACLHRAPRPEDTPSSAAVCSQDTWEPMPTIPHAATIILLMPRIQIWHELPSTNVCARINPCTTSSVAHAWNLRSGTSARTHIRG